MRKNVKRIIFERRYIDPVIYKIISWDLILRVSRATVDVIREDLPRKFYYETC
jgi:hypothetical protein